MPFSVDGSAVKWKKSAGPKRATYGWPGKIPRRFVKKGSLFFARSMHHPGETDRETVVAFFLMLARLLDRVGPASSSISFLRRSIFEWMPTLLIKKTIDQR